MNDPKPDDKPPPDPPAPPASEPVPPAPAPAEPASVETPIAESVASAIPEPQPTAPAPVAAPTPVVPEEPPIESRWSRNADAFEELPRTRKEVPPTRSWRTDGSFVALLIILPFAVLIFLLAVCAYNLRNLE